MSSQTSQGSYSAMRSQPSADQPRSTWEQQQLQQQPDVASPGPRFTSMPTLAFQRDRPFLHSQHAQHAESGLQTSAQRNQSRSANWGSSGQGIFSQASYNSQGIPSQASYNSQGIPSQASYNSPGILSQTSNASQNMLNQRDGHSMLSQDGSLGQSYPDPTSSSNTQVIYNQAGNPSQDSLDPTSSLAQGIPNQTSIPFEDSSNSRHSPSTDQDTLLQPDPSASARRTLRFSDAPLLGASTSNASQQPQGISTGLSANQSAGLNTSSAFQQMQGWSARSGTQNGAGLERDASVPWVTGDSDAGPSSTPQVNIVLDVM